MIGTFIAATCFAESMTEHLDWDVKIDKVKDEYFKETPNLPRKLKKAKRKELQKEYSFLMTMKNYDPFKFN